MDLEKSNTVKSKDQRHHISGRFLYAPLRIFSCLEYWIGLDKLHNLTRYVNCAWKLNVSVIDHIGRRHTATYERFMVGPAPRYILMVSGYQSLAEDQANMLKDSFGKAENASFTTFDVDQVNA